MWFLFLGLYTTTNSEQQQRTTFTYNPANQLTDIQRTDFQIEYIHDSNGNLVQKKKIQKGCSFPEKRPLNKTNLSQLLIGSHENITKERKVRGGNHFTPSLSFWQLHRV